MLRWVTSKVRSRAPFVGAGSPWSASDAQQSQRRALIETSPTLELPRLQALDAYDLTSVPHDPALDDLAQLAAQICNAPAALVSVIDREEIHLAGRYGVELDHTARYSLPCETTIAGEGLYQIPDTRHDPAFLGGDLVLGDQVFRFYAGIPVNTPKFVPIGALAVLDVEPRKLTATQREALELLSHGVTTRLELSLRIREHDRVARSQQRVESALTVERNFVSAVLDTVGALVVVFDTAGRIVRFNRACEVISGFQSSDLLGRYAWESLIAEEDVADYIESFDRIRAGEFPTSYENYWVTADRQKRRIAWSATALVDSQSQVAFVIATGLDVTVQRVAEAGIRESEARYRQIVEGSLGLVCTHDLSGVILSINQYGAEGVGRHVEDVVGRNLEDFVLDERKHMIASYFESLRIAGEAQGLLHLLHVNGEERVFAYKNRLVHLLDGTRHVLGFGIDITEQIRAEEKLHNLMRQSNSVLESVGDGIYGLDPEGCVTIINPAAAEMLGYAPEELIGRSMHDMTQHSYADGAPYDPEKSPILETVRNLKACRVSNEVFWRKDGTSFPVEYVARPQVELPSEDLQQRAGMRSLHSYPQHTKEPDGMPGRAVGVVVAFSDISERNALDRMKDEFISTVSHELRTPLTSLQAALGLLAGGVLSTRPEKQRQMLDIAVGNTERLSRLVNDFLELERIGSGKAELHSVLTSVDELFRKATVLLQASAAKANIEFTFDAGEVTVWADPDRIRQTLTNLISNAIKFSPQDSEHTSLIHLRASCLTEGDALLEVQDHGRGIPPEKLKQIFERFQQVDASDSRVRGGTGLGLAICRSIVQQHGGEIWATSTSGQGSTFHFTLPSRPRERLNG